LISPTFGGRGTQTVSRNSDPCAICGWGPRSVGIPDCRRRVDDHSIAGRRLQQIVADESDMMVVGEATNTEEMLGFAKTQPCDVVVTDISMPGWGELDALKELKQTGLQPPVLVLSAHPEDHYVQLALTLGARGYLTKESPLEEPVQAIREIVTGGRYISLTLTEYLACDLPTGTARPTHRMLSKREHEVLCLIPARTLRQDSLDRIGFPEPCDGRALPKHREA
jgi:two-component system, NarL family, invasion response regulator UvrY